MIGFGGSYSAFYGRRRFARRINIHSSSPSLCWLKIAASLDLDWETLAFLSGVIAVTSFYPFPLRILVHLFPAMALCKRLAASIINSDAVILKRPAHLPKSRQTEYKQRVRSVCSGSACDKVAQVQHNGRGYCKICIKLVQPELAAEALELRVELAAKAQRYSCYGAPEF